MSSKSQFNRSRRAMILACCLVLTPVQVVFSADDNVPPSNFALHDTAPDLRPVSGDPGSSDSLPNSGASAGSSEPPQPEPAPLPLFPAAATSAASVNSDSTPVPASTTSAVVATGPASLGPIRPFAAPGPIMMASNDVASSAPDIAIPGATGEALASNGGAPSIARASNNSTPAAPPSPNATINLINLMVKRKLISQEDADGLVRQSQEEADLANAQAASTQAAADRALTAQQNPAPAPAAAPTTGGDDEVRISYVPDVVKKQITDQVTQNVMQQTRDEHLADTVAASQVPDWVKRFHVAGDVRIRYENDRYPSGSAVGNFTNFNSINTSGSGFNVNTSTPQLPQYNVDKDRTRFRLRARIGAGIDLGDNFTAGMRIASGSDDNPVTENQTLGGANNGQGGNFGKYQIWLDRAFLRYDYGLGEKGGLSLTLGRFDNPFFNTSMMWADDLGFDGAVFKGKYQVTPGLTPFLTFGGFPIFNTDLNFSSNQSAKFNSEDKYLLAVQGGTHWDITKDINFTGAAAFYDFSNTQGKVSDPITNSALNAGNTDDSRPSFAQNGNTYIALRDYQDPTAVPDVTVQNQYFGLATPFNVVAVTGQLEYSGFDPFHLSLTGEFIKNVAFDRNSIINGGPASNPGPQNNTLSAAASSFDGGDSGYLIHLDLGKVSLEKLWDWNVRMSYRYVETDATIDAFTDSDFGATLTGTNLKGYTVGGNLALGSRVWAGLRWMSADNVSGPTFKNDLIQFDLNARF